MYRLDRNLATSQKKGGGGVLIGVRKDLKSKLIKANDNNIEQIFVLIEILKYKYIIGACYIPPKSDISVYEAHCGMLEGLLGRYPDCKLILAGDYNLSDAVWSDSGAFVDCPPGSPAGAVHSSFSFLNLNQVNRIPNNNGVFLDLVFSNLLGVGVSVACDKLLDDSYHHISYNIEIPVVQDKKLKCNVQYYDFRNANLLAINNFFASLDWDAMLSGCDVSVACERLYDCIYYALDLFVPVKTYRNNNFPSWFSSELQQLIVQKKSVHRRYKQTNSPYYYAQFSELRARCNQVRDVCYENYIQRMEHEISERPEMFWRHMNNLRRNADLPESMHLDDAVGSNGQDIVNMFSNVFASVYTNENHTVPTYNIVEALHIGQFSVTLSDVFTELSGLRSTLSFGPDGVPSFVLKHCVCTLSYPLFRLFALSLSKGTIPSFWKYSYIYPIYKSGDRDDVRNYRGICQQSVIPKILDKLVTNQLSLQCTGIIAAEQHGFCPKRSTTTNLLVYHQYLIESLEGGYQVDSIYTDYSKAFDRVSHCLLLKKLELMGINDVALKWLESFLVDRFQCVKINNFLSQEFRVPSGVPQGSHCGPVLFKLFTNDVGEVLDSLHLLFADDLKLYRAIRNTQDYLVLQHDLERLVSWSESNGLCLNPVKCSVITFSKSRNFKRFAYDINGDTLGRSSQVKDLGIIFDEQINFRSHISKIVGQAFKQLGFILRHGRDFTPNTLKLLYCTYVRSCLEYGALIWSPHYSVHISSIERVQRRFLKSYAFKMGRDISGFEYLERCSLLGFTSLESRRQTQDLVFVYRLVNGLVDAPNLLGMLNFNVPAGTYQMRSQYLFRCPFHRTNYGFFSPISRIQRTFNNFCDRLDLSKTFVSFKQICNRLNV